MHINTFFTLLINPSLSYIMFDRHNILVTHQNEEEDEEVMYHDMGKQFIHYDYDDWSPLIR